MQKAGISFEGRYWPILIGLGIIAGLLPIVVHVIYIYGYGGISGRELSFSMDYLITTGFTISFLSGFFSVALMTLVAAALPAITLEKEEPQNPAIIQKGVVIAGLSILTEIIFMLFVAREFSPVFFFSPAVRAIAGIMTGTLRQIV